MVSWSVKITVLDIAKKAVSVAATRTDDADPQNPKMYGVSYAVIGTAAQKSDVLNNLWAQHQAAGTQQAAISALIGSLEADAKANLEAREP